MLKSYDELADRFIDWATKEEKARALWIEGSTLKEVRRPYTKLRLHLAADEPLFPALVADLTRSIDRIIEAKVLKVSDTPRFAKELELRAGSLEFTVIVEQSNLLAKRPRNQVIPLVDKTGHLCHVMDFSLRKSS
jgi:hypothetical protein